MVAVVYLDILLIVNFLINFLLISVTAFFTGETKRRWRAVIASSLGAAFSLALLVPKLSLILSVLVKLIGAVVMASAAWEIKSKKRLARNTLYLFVSSYIFAGLVFSLKELTASRSIVINNHSVYIGVSPTFLIFTVLCLYIMLTLVELLFKRPRQTTRTVGARLKSETGEVSFNAIVDSGNKLRDAATGSGVIVLKRSLAKQLIDAAALSALEEFEGGSYGEATFARLKRFSLIPFSTVAGQGTLLGFYANSCTVNTNGGVCVLERPVFAFARDEFVGEADGILSYDSLYLE